MSQPGPSSEIKAALQHCKAHFAYAVLFNAFINILLLAFPIFSIQVYDRVMTSRSVETLVALTIGLTLALAFKAVFQWVRGALFVRAAVRIDRLLADKVMTTLMEQNAGGRPHQGTQALRDLDSFRQFATGKGALAAIDAPWAGLFTGVLIAMDPTVGLVALFCMVILSLATVLNSVLTKSVMSESNRAAFQSQAFAEQNLQSSEAIVGMGMMGAVVRRWRSLRDPALHAQVIASQRSVLFSSILGSLRIFMQAAILVAGVLEVLYSNAPSGLLFAAIIVSSLAMRPIDQLVAAWEDYLPARDGLKRVEALLATPSRSRQGFTLPRPEGHLTCQHVYYVAPGQDQPILRDVNLAALPGDSIGLIGLNGSGKTTLARLLVGNLRPTRGAIRLDGADLYLSDREDLGRYIGYLPQNVSILTGTVADNISRYGRFDQAEVVEAARMAGAHEMILKLPKGYDTPIGEGGHPLSGGQRQLIGLARAVVGKPALVILDEPNSNLDGPGEEALVSCLARLKEQKTSVVLITHRPNLVRDLDHAVVLRDGVVVSAGQTENVFKRLGRPVVVKAAAGEEKA